MEKNVLDNNMKIILFGGSAGSIQALIKIIPLIPKTSSFVFIIILHRKSTDGPLLEGLFKLKAQLKIGIVEDKTKLERGYIYVAPANYHLLFEKDFTLSLDYSEKINYSRPSIDVSFESAAEVFKDKITAILLSGSNNDGSYGLLCVKENGGITIVQDPLDAQMEYMPQHAIQYMKPNMILNCSQIAHYLIKNDQQLSVG